MSSINLIGQRITAAFDRLVYRLAYPSLQRHLTRNPALAYLFESHLRRYRQQHQLPQSLIDSTDSFLDSIEGHETNCNNLSKS